jgi:hypothetical protein
MMPASVKSLILLLLLCLPLSAQAGEPLTDRVIDADTVWQGEILIDGVVVVARKATLTIAPGSIIRFRRADRNRDGIGDAELRVLGRLVAE